jgi:hypothetical protein
MLGNSDNFSAQKWGRNMRVRRALRLGSFLDLATGVDFMNQFRA